MSKNKLLDAEYSESVIFENLLLTHQSHHESHGGTGDGRRATTATLTGCTETFSSQYRIQRASERRRPSLCHPAEENRYVHVVRHKGVVSFVIVTPQKKEKEKKWKNICFCSVSGAEHVLH